MKLVWTDLFPFLSSRGPAVLLASGVHGGGFPSQPDNQVLLNEARVGFCFLPPNDASLRPASGCVCGSPRRQERQRPRRGEALAGAKPAGCYRAGRWLRGGGAENKQCRASGPLCLRGVGAQMLMGLLGPPPWNRGPGAHFQSGPVPGTEAELIKHSLPFCKEMESHLLLEQLVLTAPPLLPSSRLLFIPGLHHLRLCFPSIN